MNDFRDLAAEYRRKADQCLHEAEQATSDELRARWLELVAACLDLAERIEAQGAENPPVPGK